MNAEILAAVSEDTFQSQLLDLMTIFGWRSFHNRGRAISGNGCKGFPDIVALRDGVGIAWEVKRQSGRIREGQVEWIAEFVAAGFDARIVRPSDFAYCEATLRRPAGQMTFTSNSTDAEWTTK